MRAFTAAMTTALLFSCSPALNSPLPLVGELRDPPDPTTHAPPFCVPGTNCTVFATACAEAYPDGAGGVWCRTISSTNADSQDLVHAGADGGELSREILGPRSYPRLAVAPSGVVAGVNNENVVTFGGQPVGTPRGAGWVAVRTAAGQGWQHYFTNQVQFADVKWATDGSLLVLGTCAGTQTVPLPLACDADPGTSLFTFARDGASVTRRALPNITSPRRLLQGPQGALYVLSASGSTTGVTLFRIDPGHEWSFSYGNASLQPDEVSSLVAADGQVWLGINYPHNGQLMIGGMTVGGSGLGGGTGIVIVAATGTLTSVQAASTNANAEGIVGFAQLPNGDVLGCWNVSVDPSIAMGQVGANFLKESKLIQFLPNGEWRGVRRTACSNIISDATGSVFLVAPRVTGLNGNPGMIRIDVK